jgi:hypothetical protein
MVAVEVDVNVGRGVSEGDGVNVSVAENVGWAVSATVVVGSGLTVQVGSIVGVGIGWINVSPPHPIENSAMMIVMMLFFCNLL